MSSHPRAAHPASAEAATPTRVTAGESGRARMPWSEVMIHLRLADAVMDFQVTADGAAVQLLSGGQPYSIPVLPGEAGLYPHPDGGYSYRPEPGPAAGEVGGR